MTGEKQPPGNGEPGANPDASRPTPPAPSRPQGAPPQANAENRSPARVPGPMPPAPVGNAAGLPPTPTAPFPGVGEAAAAQAMNPTDDEVARREQRETFNDEPRLISEAHRKMRDKAFWVFGVISVAYLSTLLILLICTFTGRAPLLYWLATSSTVDWHAWLIIGLALVIFAAVPLSLVMALVRMISHSEGEESRRSQLVTPQVEMLRICLDMLKAAK